MGCFAELVYTAVQRLNLNQRYNFYYSLLYEIDESTTIYFWSILFSSLSYIERRLKHASEAITKNYIINQSDFLWAWNFVIVDEKLWQPYFYIPITYRDTTIFLHIHKYYFALFVCYVQNVAYISAPRNRKWFKTQNIYWLLMK